MGTLASETHDRPRRERLYRGVAPPELVVCYHPITLAISMTVAAWRLFAHHAYGFSHITMVLK